jgi:hypothetical protein
VSLFELPQKENYDVECLNVIEAGLLTDPGNEDLKQL